MTIARPIVIKPRDMPPPPGPPTPGMDRRQLFEHDDPWVGWLETQPGTAGGWHHHGDRDTYVFWTRGSLIVQFGPGGNEEITLEAGDVAFIPPQTVHREITGDGEHGEAFVIRIGSGPQNVNVDGPDSAADRTG